jgi:hypothetical protein
MDRRAFLAASAVTASGLALRAAAAATEGPFGATATPVPMPPAQGLLRLAARRRSAGIMASGHENRANRPNTWLLRPLLHT